MLLNPNVTRKLFQKNKKGHIKGIETKSYQIKFGFFGIKILRTFRLTPEQLEAGRKLLIKYLRICAKDAKIKIWLRVFPHIGISSKPKEIRMGKGKGKIAKYIINAKAGQILYEFDCPNFTQKNFLIILKLLQYKFPRNICGIYRENL